MPWAVISVAGSFLVFGLLARLFACNRGQRSFLAKGFVDDVLYWFVSILFYSELSDMILKAAVGAAVGPKAAAVMDQVRHGWGWAAQQPLLVQAVLVIVIIDVVQYWLHR